MSHGFLEFADFDGAWGYSSTPSIGIAETRKVVFSGRPTLVHIRAPASRSLALEKPAQGSVASRRRAQSETLAPSFTSSDPATGAGAEQRPISAILVSFAPIEWDAAAAPHPGTPADLPRAGDADLKAVSPKSVVPGALKRAWRKEVRVVEGPPRERIGSSLEAIKSPYPLRQGELKRTLRRWMRGFVEKVRR